MKLNQSLTGFVAEMIACRGCRMGIAGTLTICSLLINGCASHDHGPPPPPASVQVEVPSFTRQAETHERQEKGGFEITIAPVTYEAIAQSKTVTAASREPLGGELIGGHAGQIYVTRTTESTVSLVPDHLNFLVTLNNKMPRVFHGSGTVVQFNVGGKVLAVDQRGYSSLQGAIVPPQQQQQVTIVGPLLTDLPAKSGTVGIFLYDVVTDQSNAGVVTAKQNYEWYFDYTFVPKSVQVPPAQQQAGYMSVAEYQQEMTRQQMEQMRGRGYPFGQPGGAGMMQPQYPPPSQQ